MSKWRNTIAGPNLGIEPCVDEDRLRRNAVVTPTINTSRGDRLLRQGWISVTKWSLTPSSCPVSRFSELGVQPLPAASPN